MVRVAVIAMLTACSGDEGTTSPTGGTGDTGVTVEPGEPTFTRIRDEVLPTCALSGCHVPGTHNGLVLAQGEEYQALVEAPSAFAPGEVLVIPGDADGSYVIKKLTGAPGIVGDPMPPPFGTGDPRLLELVREWIDAGALDN